MGTLQAGQRLPLANASKVGIQVTGTGEQAGYLKHGLLLLKGTIGSQRPSRVVHTGEPNAYDGAVVFEREPAGYSIRPDSMGQHVERAVLVVWIAEPARQQAVGLADLEGLSIRVTDGGGAEVGVFEPDLQTKGREAAMLALELYNKGGKWRVRIDGSGFLGGLPSMGSRLQLDSVQIQSLGQTSLASRIGVGSTSGGAGPAGGLPIHLPSGWAGGVQPKVPAGLVKAVGLVLLRLHNGSTASGTAFAITPGGCLVTCHHVVEDVAEMSVYFAHDKRLRKARVIVSDEESDTALIQLDDSDGCETWLPVAGPGDIAEIGTDVGLLGFPLASQMGAEINYSKGIVNSVRRRDTMPVYQSDCGSAMGSSGGPLFRQSDGHVVGILGSGMQGQGISMNINLAVSVAALYEHNWLERPE